MHFFLLSELEPLEVRWNSLKLPNLPEGLNRQLSHYSHEYLSMYVKIHSSLADVNVWKINS